MQNFQNTYNDEKRTELRKQHKTGINYTCCCVSFKITDMKKGNIVKPTKESEFILACGSGWYPDAVVISTTPFVLTSRESDMRWEATIKKEDFEITGEIDEPTLKHCMRRLKQ